MKVANEELIENREHNKLNKNRIKSVKLKYYALLKIEKKIDKKAIKKKT